MTVETASYIDDFNASLPSATDDRQQGDDHLRLLKSVLKTTFPRAAKAFRFPQVLSKTANYTVLSTDDNSVIVGAGASGNITFTLPSLSSGDAGWSIFVQCNHATNDVIIAPPSGTISGASSITLDYQYATAKIIWTGTAYIVDWDYLQQQLKNVTANRLLGRVSTTGAFQELSLGAGLSFSGSTLVATVAPPFPPQGRLSMTSGQAVNTADVSAGTAVYYVPIMGPYVPIYNGTSWELFSISELTLTLNSTPHTANNIYDVFLAENPSAADTIIIGTGPAWTTATEGSGARGSGAGTTELERFNGLLVNKNAIVLKNGSTTYSSVAARSALYVGSFIVDTTNAQLTCHVSSGATKRKWGLWNAFHRREQRLRLVDSTSSWTYNSTTVRQSRAAAANAIQLFSGYAEDAARLEFFQNVLSGDVVASYPTIGIGKNSIVAYSTGFRGRPPVTTAGGLAAMLRAHYRDAPFIGANTYSSLEALASGSTTATYYGQDADFLFEAAVQA